MRSKMMILAFLLSFAAWVMMILGAMGLSRSPDLLYAYPWAEAAIPIASDKAVYIKAGIWSRAAFFESSDLGVTSEQRIAAWSVCEDAIPIGNVTISFSSPKPPWYVPTGDEDEDSKHCNSCAEVSAKTALFVYGSILSQIPQMVTDLQRATEYGDINCQKLWGVFTSGAGLLSGIVSLRTFSDACWRGLPTKYSVVNNVDGTTIEVDVEWTNGRGFILMSIGVILKVVDVLVHLLLPTPKERARQQPNAISVPAYLRLDSQEQCSVPEVAATRTL